MAVATATAATAPISQKTHDSVGVADLEKVTDYAPEKEISGDIGKVNGQIILNKYHLKSCIAQAVSLIEERESKEKDKKAKK